MPRADTLFIEIERGDLDALRAALADSSVDLRDNYGRTPLINACLYGQVDFVDWLLGAGADVDARDKRGYTPLHFAAQEGHAALVERLLACGADPNIQDVHGNTPVWVAIMNWGGGRNLPILRGLVARDADLTLKNAAGRAALDLVPATVRAQVGL